MKLTTVLAFVGALLPVCTANFDVYVVRGEDRGSRENYQIHDQDPDCRKIMNSYGWPKKDDVSGTRLGFRCEGDDGCLYRAGGSNSDSISVLEMHFTNNPYWHFTLYKSRGDNPFQLYGTDGKIYGYCWKYPGVNLPWCQSETTGYWKVASRILRCVTDVNAASIYAAYTKEIGV